MNIEARVLAALDTVLDPELDAPITELGFVTSCTVGSDGTARVRLRLPTFYCAPNFAFLIVADAHDAVTHVEGVNTVDIMLEDHFAASEINAGVAAQAGFAAAFHGLAEDELDELRTTFARKAMLAAQDRLIRPLVASGTNPASLADLTIGDLPPSPTIDRLRSRRLALGIPSGADDPLLVHMDGRQVAHKDVPVHLRRARTTSMSIEVNGEYCRQLLAERYRTAACATLTREEPAKEP
jgi:metal-sulfur cluster biosynthetic enzyme